VGKLLRVGVFSEQMLNRDGKAKHLSSPIIYLQYLYIYPERYPVGFEYMRGT
jgi:hypothetical protein